ncbi:MAG: hypothetical protein QOE87_1966 [Gaiellales bacterium]|nr:hypothetical protein [Gaiellales bacterium]
MIVRLVKLGTVVVLARRAARHPAVAVPARTLARRFAKRREAGRWHDVPPPEE